MDHLQQAFAKFIDAMTPKAAPTPADIAIVEADLARQRAEAGPGVIPASDIFRMLDVSNVDEMKQRGWFTLGFPEHLPQQWIGGSEMYGTPSTLSPMQWDAYKVNFWLERALPAAHTLVRTMKGKR
jgi:hypothetical protein